MPRLLDRVREIREEIREYRFKYGPLANFLQKSQLFRGFIENRPLLKPVLDTLKPTPLTPEEFVRELQWQISNAKPGTTIVIYSPYLSERAIEDYIGVMRTATSSGVKIVVCTLSPNHWSIRKKELHRELIRKLREAGVEVRERMNMHEKAVIVYGESDKAAYFGSLNVLSKHGEGADYMLKFTHKDVVNALYLFLENLAAVSEQEPKE